MLKISKLLFLSFFVASILVSQVSALDEDFYSGNDITYYDKDSSISYCGVGDMGGKNAIGEVPDTVPNPWRDLINSTAPKYKDVDPRLVAATLFIENRGWPEYKTSGWASSNMSAAGPWQFIPSTWASMGTDGDGDGRKDPGNPKDAVHAAFKHQRGSNGKPIIQGATGDADADFKNIPFKRSTSGSNANLLAFLANYNGRGAPDGVTLSNFPHNENGNYVLMGYSLLTTDFKEWWSPETNKTSDATKSGKLFGNSSSNSSSSTTSGNSCPGDSGSIGAVNADGYSFPLIASKKDILNGYKWPCPSICHHDGSPAFDLSISLDDKSTGTPVAAIIDGTIEKRSDAYLGINGCQTIQLKGSDGYYYWYGHIQKLSVSSGDKVKAGQKIAEIGRRVCTGNDSYPHLHIDRGSPKGRFGGSKDHRDNGMVSLMNKIYEGLK